MEKKSGEFGIKLDHTYIELELECAGKCIQHYHKNIWNQYLISIAMFSQCL